MSARILILSIFLHAVSALQAQQSYPVEWIYKGQSFQEFVERAESVYPLKFFYEDEWVNDIILEEYQGKRMLDEILDIICSERGLNYYSSGQGNIILTKDYEIKILKDKSSGIGKYLTGSDYSSGSKGSAAVGNVVVDIGDPSETGKTGAAKLSGFVTDRDTKEAVAGVTVYFPGLSSGTVTNEYGYYSLNVPRGSHTVRFSFIGMKERILDLNIYGNGDLNLEMASVLIPLKEAVITAEKDIALQRSQAGVEKISVASLKLMPSSMGESDVTKNLLMIPGVSSVGEGSSGFNVRGGYADQNLILLYGTPLYNSSHFFGFFSAINTDIIRDVTLYKGGIPARHGGRLSSVMEIVPADGDRRKFQGNAGISPVAAHFVLEGPIIRDSLSFILTGRMTYSDWILSLMDNYSLTKSRASFHDLNARFVYDLDRKNKLEFSSYYSYDSFKYNSDTTYQYQNSLFALKWRHYFTGSFLSSISLSNSSYKYEISSMRVPQEAFNMSHRINTAVLKADFSSFMGRHEMNFGTDIDFHTVLPGRYMPAGDSSIVIPLSIERQRALEFSPYLEDKFVLTSYLTINAGIRFSSFFALGPQTVYLYNPDHSKSAAYITDTIAWSRFENYKTYAGPELRLSANFRMNSNSSLKINYNRTRQYIHLLTNTASVSPSDTWKLSDYNLRPQLCDQYAAGYYMTLNNNKVEASAELYYKKIDNMIDFKGGTDLIMNNHIEQDLINVEGKAYGFEMILRKPEGRTRWSASYTYSRMFIRSKSSFSEELINSGRWFPANFDRPHDLVLTFNYLHSRRVSFSANYSFSSGRPVTYPVAVYKIGDIVLTHFSERNKYRIPNYSRLDLAVRVSGDLRSGKIANPYWVFSVYNVLGRQNVYSAFFKNTNNSVRGYYLTVFGRPVPSLSLNFDF